MAVSTPTSAIVYTGNDSDVTPYPVTFPFLVETDVYVALTPDGGDPALLVAGVDYTLSPSGDGEGAFNGGSVVTAIPYDSTYTLTIFRQVPFTQLTEFPEAGPLPSSSIERALDKLAMQNQQLHRRVLELEGNSDGGAIVVIPENPGPADEANGTKVFADATERGNVAPSLIGQIGLQLDDKTLWRGFNTTAGAWTPLLASSATSRIFGRKTAGAGAWEECTISDILNFLASTADGDVPYRSGGAWTRKSAGADIQEFDNSGTWTKPTHAKWVIGYIVGAGGGGGSGRRGAASSARFGGGGGAGAAFHFFCLPALFFGPTVAVTIGAGGAGGAAVTANSTSGNNGSSGGNTSFGSFLCGGGAGGTGGSAASGAGGSSALSVCTWGFGAGFSSSAGGDSGSTVTKAVSPTGGGGGADIDASDVNGVGAAGGDLAQRATLGATLVTGGAGGSGTTGGNGNNGDVTAPLGTGGGGGGAGSTGAAGSGGNGARGSGGGGGGASLNGNNSGAGGTGGNGYVLICTF